MHWDAYERVIEKVILPLHEDPVFYGRGLMWGTDAGVHAVIETHEFDLEEIAVVRELATRIPRGWRQRRRRRPPARNASSDQSISACSFERMSLSVNYIEALKLRPCLSLLMNFTEPLNDEAMINGQRRDPAPDPQQLDQFYGLSGSV